MNSILLCCFIFFLCLIMFAFTIDGLHMLDLFFHCCNLSFLQMRIVTVVYPSNGFKKLIYFQEKGVRDHQPDRRHARTYVRRSLSRRPLTTVMRIRTTPMMTTALAVAAVTRTRRWMRPWSTRRRRRRISV
jgi:hypothetical protein